MQLSTPCNPVGHGIDVFQSAWSIHSAVIVLPCVVRCVGLSACCCRLRLLIIRSSSAVDNSFVVGCRPLWAVAGRSPIRHPSILRRSFGVVHCIVVFAGSCYGWILLLAVSSILRRPFGVVQRIVVFAGSCCCRIIVGCGWILLLAVSLLPSSAVGVVVSRRLFHCRCL